MIHLGGDAYKTFYFSRGADSCRYVYLIQNGEFHYFELDRVIEKKLDSLEKMAKEPA